MLDNSDEYITNFNIANKKDVAHIKKTFNVKAFKQFIVFVLSTMLVVALLLKRIL